MNHKILFLLHLPPPVHGSSIIGALIKDSQQVNDSFNCRYLNLLASQKVSDSGKLSLRKLFDFWKTFWSLRHELKYQKPDLCYFALTTTGIGFLKDSLLVFLLRIRGVRVIYHLHNKGIEKFSGSLLYRFLYRYVFDEAKVILLSERLYPDVSRYVSQNQIFICPNGLPDISRKVLKTKSLDKKDVKILFLSNLIESKGVLVLLDALEVLVRREIQFSLSIVGGIGDIDENKLNQVISQKSLTSVFRYLGSKHGGAKDKIFIEADIFTLPTYYSNECFPLVLIEAMQYSLPVISTFEGGIPDLVQDGVNGFLVPQKDVLALADRLEILIKNKELRTQFGVAGRKIYEENYTLSHFEQRLVSILSSTIDE